MTEAPVTRLTVVADPSDLFGQPFTPAEAAAAGIGRAALERMVRRSSVVRLTRGVYLGAGVAITQAVRAQALGLIIGRRQTVVGRTAAWLHGCAADALLVGLERGRGVPVELRVPGERLSPGSTVVVDGIRTTTAVAAAADLTRRLSPEAAVAALDGLLRCGALGHRDLFPRGGSAPAPAGIPPETAARCDGRADGPAESVLRLHWLEARLPTPSPSVLVGGGRIALALPVHRFGVVIAGRVPEELRAGWSTRGWRVLALDGEQVLRTDAALVRAHLEREFHQHLLSQVG